MENDEGREGEGRERMMKGGRGRGRGRGGEMMEGTNVYQ